MAVFSHNAEAKVVGLLYDNYEYAFALAIKLLAIQKVFWSQIIFQDLIMLICYGFLVTIIKVLMRPQNGFNKLLKVV